MSTTEQRDPTHQILRHLRDVIEDADMTHRQIETRAGFSRGYLSQLLGENIDLKYRHVLAVLAAIGVDASAFFGRVYPPEIRSRATPPHPLEVPDDREVVSIYGFGVEALEQLRRRLGRCEDALRALHETGVIADRDRRGEG